MSKAAKDKKKQAKEDEDRRKASQLAVDEAKKFLDKGQWSKAIEQLDSAIEKQGENAEAYNYKAYALKEQGNLEGALALYTTAIELNSAVVDTMCLGLAGRAFVYEAMGERDKAIDDFTKYISFNPHSDYAYNMRGSYRLAKRLPGLKLKNADLMAIMDDFHKAIEINENNYHAVANLGHCLFDHQRYKEAIVEYTRALSLKDDYWYVNYRRAIAYAEQVAHDEHEDEVARSRAAAADAAAAALPLTKKEIPSEEESLGAIIAEEVRESVARERKQWMRMAIQDFTRVIQEDKSLRGPDDEVCADAGAYVRRATCHLYLGEIERAHEDLIKAQHMQQRDEHRWAFIKPIIEQKLQITRTTLVKKPVMHSALAE